MNKSEIIDTLNTFKERLVYDVLDAYTNRGRTYGQDRFDSWKSAFSQLLDEALPGETATLNAKLTRPEFSTQHGETDAQRFLSEHGDNMLSYIDSLVLDVKNDEYTLKDQQEELPIQPVAQNLKSKDKVFIVHGHNGEAKERTARFIEKLGFEAIILHEQASRGMTIIEKIEGYADEVGFGIVLYTPDDMGNVKHKTENGSLKLRARQNVVFEHGFLIGKLGRDNVATLVEGAIELPNDISGVVYITGEDWKVKIAQEMKAAGYEIDLNKCY